MILPSGSLLSFFLILLRCNSNSGNSTPLQVSEAEQIALESSGELLPPVALVQILTSDLKVIRRQFDVVDEIAHVHKWRPGMLIISNVEQETFDEIHRSVIGPLEHHPIYLDTIHLVYFKIPYHPEELAKLLKDEFGVAHALPNYVTTRTSTITFKGELFCKRTYVFYEGWGYCYAGCLNRRYFTFNVDCVDGSVKLVHQSQVGPDFGSIRLPMYYENHVMYDLEKFKSCSK